MYCLQRVTWYLLVKSDAQVRMHSDDEKNTEIVRYQTWINRSAIISPACFLGHIFLAEILIIFCI